MGSSLDICRPRNSRRFLATRWSRKVALRRLGTHHLPAKYRADDRRLALESARNVERRDREERLLHRKRRAGRILRKSYGYALPHRGTTRSDAGNKPNIRALTDGGFRELLEEQSLFDREVHRRSGRAAPAMGGTGFRHAAGDEISAMEIAWANPYAKRATWWNIGPGKRMR